MKTQSKLFKQGLKKCWICKEIKTLDCFYKDKRQSSGFCSRCKECDRTDKYGTAKRLKLRFAIFKRDNFTCQYCGRKSPNVILEIDHIYPKSKGGEDKIENYITACHDCNLGKGDYILTAKIL